MTRRSPSFPGQHALTRALKGVHAAGVEHGRARLPGDGSIEIYFSFQPNGELPTQATPDNDEDIVL